ncbi:DUF1513 domain-containing protein [Ferrovibrio sp.]|uniref:DUF1513 domain-containing protein n=1 Tax=Ferrovibrio sp. TaxID=1917215 RepID=UPI003D0E4FAF
MIEPSRRGLLLGIATLPLFGRGAQASTPPALLACGGDAGGQAVFGLDAAGNTLWRRALPARGHGMTVSPDGSNVVISARRPGQWLLRLDLASGHSETWPCDDLAYGGHVIYLDAGRLAATASDGDGQGCIAVLDARTGQRIALWPTEGVDPHELLLTDGALVVANGGDVLEASNLVRLDPQSGVILARADVPAALQSLSLRHMAALPDGSVAVVAQDRGAADPAVPLLAFWRGADIRWATLGAEQGGMRGYCGAVAAHGNTLCVTSPLGAQALLHPDGGMLRLPDICGVAALGNGFALSGGRGDLLLPDGSRRQHAIAWDNHLRELA